jgi:hypothetical protein
MATQKKTLVTKAKEILIGVWNGDTAPTSASALEYVIADSLTITQDDADENTFEFETSEITETFYTLGDVNVDLNNASIDEQYLAEVMGWEHVTTPADGYVSPSSYETRYVALQVKFSDTFYVYLPKIAIGPKLNFESVKTSLAYGTLSGKATAVEVGGKTTAMGVFKTAILTKSESTDA